MLLTSISAFGFNSNGQPTWYDFRDTSFLSEDNGSELPAYITTPEQLAQLSWLVNEERKTFKGKLFQISADIDLNRTVNGKRVNWVPIGYEKGVFDGMLIGAINNYVNGTIDGSYTISGMYINDDAGTFDFDYYGLVGRSEGVIAYLNIENPHIYVLDKNGNNNGYQQVRHAGAVCGRANGDMIAIHLGSSETDLFVPSVYNVTVKNVDIHVCSDDQWYIGGIAGHSAGVAHCNVTGKLYSNVIYIDMGGIVGHLYEDTKERDTSSNITDCLANVSIKSRIYGDAKLDMSCSLGGIAGSASAYSYHGDYGIMGANITSCSAMGEIVCYENGIVGGICGETSSARISGCSSTMSLSGGTFIGGIAGHLGSILRVVMEEQTIFPSIEFCAYSGHIDAQSAKYAGGLCGNIEYSYTHLALSASLFAGTMTMPSDKKYCSATAGSVKDAVKSIQTCYYDKRLFSGTALPGTNNHNTVKGLSTEQLISGNPTDVPNLMSESTTAGFTLTEGRYPMAYSNELWSPCPRRDYSGYLNMFKKWFRNDMPNMVYQPGAWLCTLPITIARGDCAYEFMTNAVVKEYKTEMPVDDWNISLKNSWSFTSNPSVFEVDQNQVTARGIGQCPVTIGCSATTEAYPYDRPKPVGGSKKLMLDASYGKVWDGSVASGLEYGTGIAEDPYLVRNGAQLAYVMQNNKQGEYYEQISDIFLNEKEVIESMVTRSTVTSFNKWTNPHFDAHYDGMGHIVYRLVTVDQYQSLFGNIGNSGTVSNVGLAESAVVGTKSGFLALVCNGKISNCIIHGYLMPLHTYENRGIYGGGICMSVGASNENAVIEDCIVAISVNSQGYIDFSPFVPFRNEHHGVVRNCLSVSPYFYSDDNGITDQYSVEGHSFIQNCYWLKGYESNDKGYTLDQIQEAFSTRRLWTCEKGHFPTLQTFAETDLAKLLSLPIRSDIDYEMDGKKNRLYQLTHHVEFASSDAKWEVVKGKEYIEADGELGVIVPIKNAEGQFGNGTGNTSGYAMLKASLGKENIYISLHTANDILAGIHFVDDMARQACVNAFDTDRNGFLSLTEVMAVNNEKSKDAFQNTTARSMQRFPEFRFFKGITDLTTQLQGLPSLLDVSLPYNAQTLHYEAFKGSDKLQTVTLSPKMTTIEPGAFYNSSVDSIKVDYRNEKFESRGGVLFTTDNVLVAYPNGRDGEEAVAPGLITSIAEGALYKVPGVRRLYFDTDDMNTVPTITSNSLISDDGSLLDVYLSDATTGSKLLNKYKQDASWASYAAANKLHIYFPLKINDSVYTRVNGKKQYVGTFYIGFDTEFPESLTPYTVPEAIEKEFIAYLSERERLVPARTALLVMADAPGVYKLSPLDEPIGDWNLYENKLIGTDEHGLKLGQQHSAQGSILSPALNEQGELCFRYDQNDSIPPFHAYITYNTVSKEGEEATNPHYDVAMAVVDMGMFSEGDYTFSIHHDVIDDYYMATIIQYDGQDRNIVVPQYLHHGDMTAEVTQIGARAFAYANSQNKICNIDLSQCYSLEPICVDREDKSNPFYRVNRSTYIYLPDGIGCSAAPEQANVIIGNQCELLLIDWDWDFIPPYDFYAKKAYYTRILCNYYDFDNNRSLSRAYAICLPFKYDFNAQPDFNRENLQIYSLKYISDKYEFVFDHHGYVMEEGTPYLIVVKDGSNTIEAENVHVTDYTRSVEVKDFKTFERVGDWKGTFRRITSVEAEPMLAYGLQWDGKWKRYRTDYEGYENAWIGAGLSYFSFDSFSGRNAYSTVVGGYNGADDEDGYIAPFPADLYDGDDNIPDDDLTDITPTFRTLDADGSSRYFDLQGRQIDNKPQHGMFINNNKKTIIK